MNFQVFVTLPLPMERKLHSEACTEFKMQSDYFYGARTVIGRYQSGQLKLFYAEFCEKILIPLQKKRRTTR